jgi:hypothetical protein
MKKILILLAFIPLWGYSQGVIDVDGGGTSSDTTGNYIIRAQQIHDSLDAIRADGLLDPESDPVWTDDSAAYVTLTDTTNDKVMTRHDLDDLLSNAGSLSDVAKMLGDSTAYFAFMLGRGIAVDTAVMVSGAYGGVFCTGQDSAKITVVKSVMVAGTGTEAATFNVFWGPVFGTAVDSLFTAAAAITTHTGESDVPNRHYKAIPPRNFVWGIFRGFVVGHRPTLISATIIYYIKRD